MILSFRSINQLFNEAYDQIEVFISIADEIFGSLGEILGSSNYFGTIKAQQISFKQAGLSRATLKISSEISSYFPLKFQISDRSN